MNLAEKVTVFVPTVGALTVDECVEAIGEQDCEFVGPIMIENVAPLSAAYQRMLDTCETPYFVSVDEDMILRPNAVSSLYRVISQTDPEGCALVALPLWDVHIGRPIMGVKIHRLSIVKRYPYRDVQSCEMDQIGRMKADGLWHIAQWGAEPGVAIGELSRWSEHILGDHGITYTPKQAYERYWDLTMKARRFPWLSWTTDLPIEFARRCIKNDSSITDVWALLGCAAALVSDPRHDPGEKDFRRGTTSPGFAELHARIALKGPQDLVVYQTSKCSQECVWCRRTLQGSGCSEDVTPKMALRALNTFPSIRSVCIAGFGEPLLSPYTIGVAQACKAEGKIVSLITNGTELSRYSTESLAAFDHITVSLNAASDKEHAEVTGVEGNWERVLTAAQSLARTRPISFSFVISKSNWHLIPQYLATAKSVGVTGAYLVNLLPHVGPNGDRDRFLSEVLRLDDTDWREEQGAFEAIAAELGVNVMCWPQRIGPPEDNPRLCRSPWETLGIDGVGWTAACRRITPPAEGETSHIRDGYRVWASPPLVDIRRRLEGADELPFECAHCFGCWQGSDS